VTETDAAGAPSTPVTGDAVTVTGDDPVQPLTPITLVIEFISASATVQDPLLSEAVFEFVEAYMAATRAAFSVEIKP